MIHEKKWQHTNFDFERKIFAAYINWKYAFYLWISYKQIKMELRAIVYSVFSVLLSIANVESRGPQQVTYVKCKKFIYHMTILFHFIWNTTFLTQVTCGSVLKLQNVHHKIRLHSHDVKYGSGSGQQSVTGTEVKEDVNSHWAIKGM